MNRRRRDFVDFEKIAGRFSEAERKRAAARFLPLPLAAVGLGAAGIAGAAGLAGAATALGSAFVGSLLAINSRRPPRKGAIHKRRSQNFRVF